MKPLNFSEVIPYTVANWIESNNNGDSYNYNKGKEDTMTVIGRLERLPFDLFNRYDRLKSWFLKNLEMREAKSGSLYRAFLSLRNDKNINLRVADHYSTENSTIRAAELFGSSDYEYHLNVLNDDKGGKRGEIRNSRLVEYEEISVDVIVATIWLDEFVVDGDENCNKALDDLIFLLKYGRINNDTNESLSNLSYIVGFEQFEKYKNNTMIHIKRIDEMSSYEDNNRKMFTNYAFDAIREKCPRSVDSFEEIEDDDDTYGVRMLAYPNEMSCLSDEYTNYRKEVEDSAREDYLYDKEHGRLGKHETFEDYLETYEAEYDVVGYYYLEITNNGTNYTISARAEINGDNNVNVGEKTIFEQDVVFDGKNRKKFMNVLYHAADELAKEIYR